MLSSSDAAFSSAEEPAPRSSTSITTSSTSAATAASRSSCSPPLKGEMSRRDRGGVPRAHRQSLGVRKEVHPLLPCRASPPAGGGDRVRDALVLLHGVFIRGGSSARRCFLARGFARRRAWLEGNIAIVCASFRCLGCATIFLDGCLGPALFSRRDGGVYRDLIGNGRLLRRRRFLFDGILAEGEDLLDETNRHGNVRYQAAAICLRSIVKCLPLWPVIPTATSDRGSRPAASTSVKFSVCARPFISTRIVWLLPIMPSRWPA